MLHWLHRGARFIRLHQEDVRRALRLEDRPPPRHRETRDASSAPESQKATPGRELRAGVTPWIGRIPNGEWVGPWRPVASNAPTDAEADGELDPACGEITDFAAKSPISDIWPGWDMSHLSSKVLYSCPACVSPHLINKKSSHCPRGPHQPQTRRERWTADSLRSTYASSAQKEREYISRRTKEASRRQARDVPICAKQPRPSKLDPDAHRWFRMEAGGKSCWDIRGRGGADPTTVRPLVPEAPRPGDAALPDPQSDPGDAVPPTRRGARPGPSKRALGDRHRTQQAETLAGARGGTQPADHLGAAAPVEGTRGIK